jgi:glutamate-1-semialdehyde 2,1-aminomutase
MIYERSKALFNEALRLIPGGVNSPVRACKSVGCTPLFIIRAQGSHIYDLDGNDFLDYVGSWGPMILGHAHPQVMATLKKTIDDGTSYGAPTEKEVEMARLITEAVSSIELVRMVNSGTEATMSALRMARGFTGRDLIVKFDGCYHGHADTLLVRPGSGVATLGIPESPGVPADIVKNTISVPYNGVDAFCSLMEKRGHEVAAVIVEPVAGNMGVVSPVSGFLEELRKQTRQCGALLIFDEVITGFRLAWGGAQERFGILPDVTCLGKIIGGGLPVGAYGGREEIMRRMAPDGDVYQAGTLSGNPLAMTAGIETLRILKQGNFYKRLEKKSNAFWEGLESIALESPLPITVNREGSMGSLFFNAKPVKDLESAMSSDAALFTRFYQGMLEKGIYLAPSPFEAMFISMAHTTEELERTLEAVHTTLRTLA